MTRFFRGKTSLQTSKWNIPRGAPRESRTGKNCNFQPKYKLQYISAR